MLSARSIAIVAVFAVIACHRLSSDERKLIGTWETGSIDAVWRITFKSDHTLSLTFEDLGAGKFEDPLPGAWQLKDSQLTTDVDVSKMEATLHEKGTPHILTEKITFVSDDKIERSGGYPYTRVK
jgi:hypothetical protein